MSKTSFLLGVVLAVSIIRADAQNQCEGVPGFVEELRELFAKFPTKPSSNAKADSLLAEMNKTDPRLLREATVLAKRYTLLNEDQRVCVANQFLMAPVAVDRDVNFWFDHVSKRIPYPLRSPEFPKGFGLHLELSQGAAGLGGGAETYVAAARALLSFTAGNRGHHTGGRWRGLAGVSTYYQNTEFLFFFNPRVEYRIMDFALGDLATIGNLKAIVDANIGETTIIGAGLGAELHVAGIQLLYQRQRNEPYSYFLVGLFFRFQ
jgi:hypothetical protein